MHKKLEISDWINELFRIESGEFNPKIHFDIADRIVKEVAHKPFWSSRYDFFEAKGPTGRRYEAERERIGEYVIKPVGRLNGITSYSFFPLLGLNPKIEIVHWRDRIIDDQEHVKIEIAYREERATGVAKYYEKPLSFVLPG